MKMVKNTQIYEELLQMVGITAMNIQIEEDGYIKFGFYTVIEITETEIIGCNLKKGLTFVEIMRGFPEQKYC